MTYRKISVDTETTPSGKWIVEVDEKGNALLKIDTGSGFNQVITQMTVGEAFHVGALLVEAAAKSCSTKTKIEIGPNLKKVKTWASFDMKILTDEQGNNLKQE